MSQYLLPTIDPSVNTGSQLSAWLNLWAQAVQTQQMGASRPVDAQAGMIWIKDVSPVLQQLMVFDGADDLELLNWNPSTNVVSYPGAVKGPGSSDIYNLASWGGDNGDTLLDTGFEIQSSVTDTVGNKVMRVGAFGLGGAGGIMAPNNDANDIVANGLYTFYDTTINTPIAYASFSCIAEGGQQIALQYWASSTPRMFIRSKDFDGTTWGAWREIWNSANLVKQTSAYDATAGAMMAVGAFGLGGKAQITGSYEDANALPKITGLYGMYGVVNTPAGTAAGAFLLQLVYNDNVRYQTLWDYVSGGIFVRQEVFEVWTSWRTVAFTAGSAFTGETQFESIKASGTIKSAGGQVSAADMEAFTAVQVNEAGQPLPPTFLADLENQITAMQAQITALQAQVEELQP